MNSSPFTHLFARFIFLLHTLFLRTLFRFRYFFFLLYILLFCTFFAFILLCFLLYVNYTISSFLFVVKILRVFYFSLFLASLVCTHTYFPFIMQSTWWFCIFLFHLSLSPSRSLFLCFVFHPNSTAPFFSPFNNNNNQRQRKNVCTCAILFFRLLLLLPPLLLYLYLLYKSTFGTRNYHPIYSKFHLIP